MSPTSETTALQDLQDWSLEDAQSHFSELIQLAQQHPQRVTLHDQEGVVILSTAEFKKLLPLLQQPNLQQLLATSPLNRLEFTPAPTMSPIRPVEL